MQCIDIFSGGGIGALGYQRAGFEHRLFVEWDPWATMTLQANYPGVSIDNRNLFLYSMAEVFEDHGIAIDFEGLIAMSPPCQGHSTAGTQGGREDLRNSLLGKVVEAAEYAPQAWIVMENVKGLTAGTSADLLVELESALLDLGRRPFRWILDAKEYGVPSSRPRLFLLIPPLFRVPTQFWDEYPPSPPEKHKELVTTREAIGKTFVDLDPEFREMSENEVVLYSGIGPSQNWTASEFGRLYGALKEHGPTSDLLRRPTWDAPDLPPVYVPPPALGRGSFVAHFG